ncbi:MAG: ROK family protein [Chloroflexota bacterium]
MNNNLVVALSVGQSKIGAGAIDYQGNLVCLLDEIATPQDTSARYAAVAQQILAVIHEVGLPNVSYVGISYPELVPPPPRVVANLEILPTTADPIHDAIAVLVSKALDSTIKIELMHDAAAAALGEVSPKGTLPGCQNCIFIVWGTGVASGIISGGKLYWHDPIIHMMTGEAGLQVIRTATGAFAYSPLAHIPELGPSELRFDRWLRGPEIAQRFREEIRIDGRGPALLELANKSPEEIDLIDINRVARENDPLAIQLIESAGQEMGQALAPFIAYWFVERKMAFAKTIIIGSGVAKLGDGLNRAGQGILISAIRRAIEDTLSSLGVYGYNTSNVILSEIGYEREFYAFI